MSDDAEFDAYVAMLADIVAMSRKLQARGGPSEPLMFSIPKTTAAAQWREMIARLNAIDPEGGWGRLQISGVEMVATKGDFPGGERVPV